jgi:hypothetical protein
MAHERTNERLFFFQLNNSTVVAKDTIQFVEKWTKNNLHRIAYIGQIAVYVDSVYHNHITRFENVRDKYNWFLFIDECFYSCFERNTGFTWYKFFIKKSW